MTRTIRVCILAAACGLGAAALAQPAPPVATPKMQKCTGGYQPPVMIPASMARIVENYPERALREGAEGVVGAAITVGVDGRAMDVEITQRAESEYLNDATITGILRYGRFMPALQDCKPVVGELSKTIRWALG
jgi:outer membrane biosynthesis protein TonB